MPERYPGLEYDVAVLRQKIHGMAADQYAEAVRERLPDADVRLARTPEAERRAFAEADVATGYAVDPEDLVDTPVRLFACVYAGTDHLPLDHLAERGVAVTSAAGVHGPNVAEHVLGAVLWFTRRFHVGRRRQDRREWRSYQARELAGETVTVVGLGNIGQAVVDRLDGFDVETVGVRYSPEKGGPTDAVYGFDDLHDALADTDYLVCACPLTEETRGLVDAAALETLPPSAVLVNVARGPVVDTGALVDALRANSLRGASLDVTDPEPLPPDHPLWGFDNVQITPHNAGHTPQYYERRADILAANLARAAEDGFEDLENQVR
ncbi:MAG: D-2-hydroxyacid dehydrogenase [Halobacteriaceae archaeon]